METLQKSPQLSLELRGITKKFPGIVANDSVDFDLREGEIHTILGENGAGKSTLMNMIAGLFPADSGVMRVFGEQVNFTNPRQAIEKSIGMVFQHFMLVKNQMNYSYFHGYCLIKTRKRLYLIKNGEMQNTRKRKMYWMHLPRETDCC